MGRCPALSATMRKYFPKGHRKYMPCIAVAEMHGVVANNKKSIMKAVARYDSELLHSISG